jgi:tetratricopeptide (TPR) repeat protein
MGSLDWGSGFRGSRNTEEGANFSTGGASHLIRSAEKLASSGRYDFAIEQLAVAQRLDPGNRYIQAIMDRIRAVQTQDGKSTFNVVTEGSTPLSVTVDPRFTNGIRSQEDDQSLTPQDIPTKIRFLTNMAEQYLESGSSERAFDSLMKAYLLDPSSPYVIASEKAILPAWETSRSQMNMLNANRSLDLSNNISNKESQTMAQTNTNGINNITPRSFQQEPPSADERLRMEMLTQQKEQERLEKERSEWRDASRPFKIFGEDDAMNESTPQEPAPERPKPQTSGLFSKLRLGKFLE